jgi:hypothetical protein
MYTKDKSKHKTGIKGQFQTLERKPEPDSQQSLTNVITKISSVLISRYNILAVSNNILAVIFCNN